MAIAFGSANGVQSNSGTSHSFSLTVSGDNRLLLVCPMIASTRTVTNITFNGDALTSINRSGGSQTVGWWYLIAPDVGTYNVIVTTDASTFCYPSGGFWTGVDQTNPIDANTTNTSGSCTLTTTTDNCWAVLGVRDANDGATTAGTNCTSRHSPDTQLYDSGGDITPGSFTMTANDVTTGTSAMVAFKPHQEADTGNFFMFF